MCPSRETNITVNINAVALVTWMVSVLTLETARASCIVLGKEWKVTAYLYAPILSDIILSA